jgi:tetratricopeptide (TPR) repeat protein
MAERPIIKIFIASAAELKEEREKGILLINHLNKSHKHLNIEPVEWEYDMVHSNYPEHATIQDAINPKLKESELAVFIFYSKIGSNTLKEFEYAIEDKKRIFLYFKTGFSPDDNSIGPYGELLQFKKSLNNSILKKHYKDLKEFENEFYPNLNLYLVETYPIATVDSASNTALSQTNLALIKMLGEKDEEIKKLNENLRQLPNAETKNQLQQLMQEKEAISKELLQSEEVIKQQIREKEALEKQLVLHKGNDALKAKALEEVEKGNYSEAETYLKESAKESISETASTFYELAKIKKLQFQYAEAFSFYELTVKVDTQNSLYLNDAGVMANALGYYDKAIGYYEKSLGIEIKRNGEKHPEIASRYNNLGEAYNNKGEYNKAIEYSEKALVIDKKFYGDEHSDIARDYVNLGLAYSNKGEYDKAIKYYEKALVIDKKFYGKEHPHIATSYNNLGFAYNSKREYDKAIEYYEKALAIDNKFYGEEYPGIAIRYNNLGAAYNNKGGYDKAIQYYEKALVIDKKFYGEEHPKIATRYNNLGAAYNSKAEYDKAIDYYNQSLFIIQKFLPSNHPNIQILQENLAIAKDNLRREKNEW